MDNDTFEMVEAIIAEHGDADMSSEEIVSLLTENGVDEDLAREVAEDMRP